MLGLLVACTHEPVRPTPPPPEHIEKIPDAVPRDEPRSRSGNPKFYEVFGKRYFVLEKSDGYVERGVASWYGPNFHEGRTSSGEKYDMYAMTAAHKTLPLPCYAEVTNLTNGHRVIVRVNDRGPFVDNRLIDLSYTAASKLGVIQKGTALVEVRAVGPQAAATPVPTPVAPVPVDRLYIQAGAFAEQTNADRLLEKLRAAGIGPAFVRQDTVKGRPLYRVRVGPVPSVEEFDQLVQDLKGVGIPDAHLAPD